MTEQDWLASTDPVSMLEFSRHPAHAGIAGQPYISDRQLRLFTCACCRQVWHLLTDDAPCERCGGAGEISNSPGEKGRPWNCSNCHGTGRVNRSRRAVEVAERLADGLATERERQSAQEDAFRASPHRRHSPETAAHDACCMYPQEGDYGCVPPATQANLLRDIIGNPFQASRDFRFFQPDWLTPQVQTLAQLAYEDRPRRKCPECEAVDNNQATWYGLADCSCHGTGRIDDGALDPLNLAVLADALDEAGCDNQDILYHLRGVQLLWDDNRSRGTRLLSSPHVRGCWVLDLLLGKS